MSRYPRVTATLFIVVIVAAGAAMNLRLRHLRESEAYYRWLLAAAVNERLFQDASEDSRDRALFEESVARAEASGMFDNFQWEDDVELEGVSLLGRVARDYQQDRRIWDFARSRHAAGQRREFITLARQQKLMFATDIQYAEAQAGGVNIFNLFFGFRKIAANLIWLEVDRYWHQGNMYRMITLMRTCVALDPQFVEAYLIGAWHLGYNATAQMPDTPWPQRQWHPVYQACLGEKERFYFYAIDFLKDGIRRNPRNYRLYFDLGFAMYKQKLEDYPNAVKYLSEAVRLPHDRWVPRQLFQCQELNGQHEEALAGWQDYVERYPGSMTAVEVAPRFILRNQGLIYEKRAEELRRQAKATDAPARAEQLKAEAEEYWRRARDTWNDLNDPFGEGRKMRMEALDMREEGRYLEAIAILDKARWDTAALWQEFSELIIELKQEAGIPLSVSEKKAVMRESEVGVCPGMPPEERERRLRAAEEIEAKF